MRVFRISAAVFAVFLSVGFAASGPAQELSSADKMLVKAMLASVKNAVRISYHDPDFGGIDLDVHFAAAAGKLERATSLGHAYGIIAQALLDFDDSQTYFIPPASSTSVDYGWTMKMIGDTCFITAVRPGSDARAKGLSAGDRVLQVDEFKPTRRELWKVRYLLDMLNPRASVRLVVQSPARVTRTVDVAAAVSKRAQVAFDEDNRSEVIVEQFHGGVDTLSRSARVGPIAIWKLSDLNFKRGAVAAAFDASVKGASSLILDLRGNSRGYMHAVEELASRLFDREVVLGELRGRKATKIVTSGKPAGAFTGPLVVLVDADTGSSAEVVARVVQLEKRGTVVGDRSAGAVGLSDVHTGVVRTVSGVFFFYSSIMSEALFMADGNTLEKKGLQPDETVLPIGADLAASRDLALSRAIEILGGSLDPVAAGAMFPVRWK